MNKYLLQDDTWLECVRQLNGIKAITRLEIERFRIDWTEVCDMAFEDYNRKLDEYRSEHVCLRQSLVFRSLDTKDEYLDFYTAMADKRVATVLVCRIAYFYDKVNMDDKGAVTKLAKWLEKQ